MNLGQENAWAEKNIIGIFSVQLSYEKYSNALTSVYAM
jgi:hypothetical protein